MSNFNLNNNDNNSSPLAEMILNLNYFVNSLLSFLGISSLPENANDPILVEKVAKEYTPSLGAYLARGFALIYDEILTLRSKLAFYQQDSETARASMEVLDTKNSELIRTLIQKEAVLEKTLGKLNSAETKINKLKVFSNNKEVEELSAALDASKAENIKIINDFNTKRVRQDEIIKHMTLRINSLSSNINDIRADAQVESLKVEINALAKENGELWDYVKETDGMIQARDIEVASLNKRLTKGLALYKALEEQRKTERNNLIRYYGPVHDLLQKDIASITGLSESEVSRIINNK